MKNLMIFVGIFALMFGGLAFMVRRYVQNHVTILNQSGEEIAWVRVEVCRQTFDFEDIPNGHAKSSVFKAMGDSGYRVTGQLEDGTKVSYKDGYVTNSAYGLWATFMVERGGKIVFVYD